MENRSTGLRSFKSWAMALMAVSVCGPWPHWDPGAATVIGFCTAFALLARPKGREWWHWSAVAVAMVVALWPSPGPVGRDVLSSQLDSNCREMLAVGEELATDADLIRLLGAEGEVVDPSLPFEILDRAARGSVERTVFLVDERGQIVAWGGAGRFFPYDIRPLGLRQWGVAWTAGGADLWLRDPLLVDGRLIGTVVVADHSELQAERVWGMGSSRDHDLAIGTLHDDAVLVEAAGSPGVKVPVAQLRGGGHSVHDFTWLGWLALAVVTLVLEPQVAWLVVLVGSFSLGFFGRPSDLEIGLVLLLAGASLGRFARVAAPALGRILLLLSIAIAALSSIIWASVTAFAWLPEHLFRPGWGGLWMVALAWAVVGWPGLVRDGFRLDRRLRVGIVLAVLGLAVYAARIPVNLGQVGFNSGGVVLPRGELRIEDLLPAPVDRCGIDDLAPTLAARWKLEEWSTPSELRLLDGEGYEVSRWGDLAPAGENIRVVRRWPLDEFGDLELELLVATDPWSHLRDWRPGRANDQVYSSRVWSAVLSRSGDVAASLHPEIRDLDAVAAGELFHAGGGWTWMEVGDSRRLAKVSRHEQWLVASISHFPSPSDWVVRAAIGLLWALMGTVIAVPPVLRRQDLSTFGGRLRLLVAGGVVVPLAILTLFLHQRISDQEERLEQSRGLEALRAARYAAVHLGGGFAVDDELARWLASGWGGEVELWDGISLVAASRFDLASTGDLLQLPAPSTFPPYLVGRDDLSVVRWKDRFVAAGPVDLQGNRLLLHLYRAHAVRSVSDLGAVDWLLTGALVSALVALVLTTRVEERLSASLRDLVALARKLLDGEPVGPLRRPRETDLAEVLDAVGSMNEEVQQRETSLRHQEELLRITLRTLDQAVVVLEPDGTERFANPSAVGLKEEYGEAFLDRLHEVVLDASVGGTATKTVQPIAGRDLTWRIGVAGVPFPDGARGLVAVVDDVTDLVRADRVQQLNQMARIVAHEVKNPLTPVRLWVQELEAAAERGDPELSRLLEEACSEIAIQVARLQETANSFSNLVALEQWEPEAVNLESILIEVPSGPKIFGRRGISFEREISSPVPPPVMGDRHWLRRAVANVVQNSIDALDDGPGRVVLRLFQAQGSVVLEVEDTGGGVPDDRLTELFAPHFSTTNAGSGLGLALVHQVVARCQGRVEAANGEDGLRIRLEFPSAG